jgi:hypothetical protein
MDERPFPHGPLPVPPPSRRGFLVAGGLAALAAGGGVWLAVSAGEGSSTPASPTASRDLRAAAAAEQALLAQVDAAARHAHGSDRDLLRAVRADHVAHLAAIEASIADALYPSVPSTSASASAPAAPAGVVRIPDLRSAEVQAARAAAARAARLTGRSAVLLASIAAAEATHAELLK